MTGGARNWREMRAEAVAAGKVDETRVAAERRRIEQKQKVNRPVIAKPLPNGAARDAGYDLMMRLGEAVNAAHHVAAVSPEEARIVGLDDVVDRWAQELAAFYWRTVALGERGLGERRREPARLGWRDPHRGR